MIVAQLGGSQFVEVPGRGFRRTLHLQQMSVLLREAGSSETHRKHANARGDGGCRYTVFELPSLSGVGVTQLDSC